MTINERKFVVTALELLRYCHATEGYRMPALGCERLEQAIKALEVALGL